jgi:hypothetical protein
VGSSVEVDVAVRVLVDVIVEVGEDDGATVGVWVRVLVEVGCGVEVLVAGRGVLVEVAMGELFDTKACVFVTLGVGETILVAVASGVCVAASTFVPVGKGRLGVGVT